MLQSFLFASEYEKKRLFFPITCEVPREENYQTESPSSKVLLYLFVNGTMVIYPAITLAVKLVRCN